MDSLYHPLALNPFGITPVALNSHPDFADIDGDGDFDLFVGTGDGSIFARGIVFGNLVDQELIKKLQKQESMALISCR